ncbi:hypothetical protein FRC08_000660 [Ceratobasidium sp. 394]|nr:hypothetical protein FRC08_000660 [Ceratobasidium sp. 394]KAG9095288.1 hypothetical protein FS749_010743 [Ceratobasidium sp. UAMH 11750]
MATASSIPCEVFLTEDGDLARVAAIHPLRATFGVPGREPVQTATGVLLFTDPSSFNGKHKYALLSSNGKTVISIGDPVDNLKKAVLVTADGAGGDAAHEGEGEWYYFH